MISLKHGRFFMELKGSKTEKNLKDAFSSEARVRVRYELFASIAEKEGYFHIADAFRKTAENELTHARMWEEELGDLLSTAENLSSAANGENYEWTDMYSRYAAEAGEEGFDAISEKFLGVAAVEHAHEERFRSLLSGIENGTVFRKDCDVTWICRECGHLSPGRSAPDICPVCSSPGNHFKVKN